MADDNRPTVAMITDGLSNTIMFGERAGGGSHYINGQAVTSPASAMAFGWAAKPNDITMTGYQSDGITNPGIRAFNANNDEFYSFHTNGGVFGIADGSVRFINSSISIQTFAALLTIQGGETISGDF